jgi:8-oxo-dGTP diphosphatase
MSQSPRVGVGVMIFKDGRVLLGERRGSHGAGEFSFPGGHLEHLESFEDCGRREVREEAGIEIQHVKFQYLANARMYAPKHYTHIGLVASWLSGEPKVLEPNKCAGWGWYLPAQLPKPMFAMCALAFDALQRELLYYDADAAEQALRARQIATQSA